jgi:polar amino acid transport system substrate-binding protein
MRPTLAKLIAPIALLSLASLAACASSGGSGSDGSASPAIAAELIAADTLTVCTNPPYEPFELEGDGGEIVGLDMDLAKAIAAKLGPNVQVKAVSTPFETIESGVALETGTCDLLASGITIKEERKAKFDFTDPYFDVNLGVLTKDPSITDTATLKGKKVSAQIGTTGLTWSQEQGLDYVEFKDLGLQVQALKVGDVDAAVGDVAVLAPFIADGYTVSFEIPSSGQQFGFGVKKGNTGLLDTANAAIAELKSSGAYAAIYEQWIGIPPAAN